MEFRSRYRRSLSAGTYSGTTAKGDFRCGICLQSTLKEMRFEDCRMEQINFSGSKFEECHFVRCNLSGANFNATTFHDSSFSDCTLDMAGFRGASLWRTKLVGGRAEYSSFEETLVRDCLFDLQLHGADLRFSSTKGLDMGTSNLWAASANFSCRNFRDVRYSEDQVQTFLGLIARTTGNDELRKSISGLLSAKTARIIEVLVRREQEV
jgi:hypothetical protein